MSRKESLDDLIAQSSHSTDTTLSNLEKWKMVATDTRQQWRDRQGGVRSALVTWLRG